MPPAQQLRRCDSRVFHPQPGVVHVFTVRVIWCFFVKLPSSYSSYFLDVLWKISLGSLTSWIHTVHAKICLICSHPCSMGPVANLSLSWPEWRLPLPNGDTHSTPWPVFQVDSISPISPVSHDEKAISHCLPTFFGKPICWGTGTQRNSLGSLGAHRFFMVFPCFSNPCPPIDLTWHSVRNRWAHPETW